MSCQGQDDHAAIAGVALVPCALVCGCGCGLVCVCLSVVSSFTHKAASRSLEHTQATRPERKGRAVMRGQTTKPMHGSIAADHFTRSHTTVRPGAHPRPSLPLTTKLCREVVVVKDGPLLWGCKKGAEILLEFLWSLSAGSVQRLPTLSELEGAHHTTTPDEHQPFNLQPQLHLPSSLVQQHRRIVLLVAPYSAPRDHPPTVRTEG
jgi:hypothetical protein